MSDPSAFEQMMLEYLNRARLDPQGEFDRFIVSTDPVQAIDSKITSALKYFSVDLNVYRQQLEGLEPAAPLAWNSALNDAATAHSQLMIQQDTQSHVLPGESGLGTRIGAAGYDHWAYVAENIYAYTYSPAYGHAGFFIDWGNTPTGIQTPAGHRNSIMNPNLTEVGIGVVEDNNPGTAVGPYVVTQDFGTRWDYEAQFVGVVYDDDDVDVFYSMGEGRDGVTVVVSPEGGVGGATETQAAGGYQIEGLSGMNTVTFSGGGLSGAVSVDVMFGDENVKVDLVNGTRIESSADAELGGGAVDLTLLGQGSIDAIGNSSGNALLGNSSDNLLWGRAGNDRLDAGGGDDTLKGNTGNDTIAGGEGDDWAHAGKHDDLLDGGNGSDRMYGGSGSDTLVGGEGSDWLQGNADADVLYGGNGSDWIHGGMGNDAIHGGPGSDTLIGGEGQDRFVYESPSDSTPGLYSRDVISGDLTILASWSAIRLTSARWGCFFCWDRRISGVQG